MKVFLLKNENSPVDYYRQVLSAHYDPEFVPLLTHSLQLESTIHFLQHEISNYKVLIVTSQRAVECLQQALESHDILQPIKDLILSLPVYTIGPSTSQYLNSIGFKSVFGRDSGNGHKLSELILENVDKETKIIYFTGKIRKDIIPGNLRNNDMDFNELVVYSTEELGQVDADKVISHSNQNWIIFFSSQGTKSIVDKVKELQETRTVRIGVIGPTTNEYLVDRGIKVDFICDSPTADNLLDKLRQHTK